MSRRRFAHHTVGVDIGGTKVLAGVVDGEGEVLARLQRQTPGRTSDPSVVETTVVDVVRELADSYPVAAVGVGAAGFVDASGSRVLFSPHLSWRDEPLRDALVDRLRMPVVVDNDANTAAWAEHRFGAARGYRQVLCLTLGTGIGGALLVDGTVLRGAQGMAGEFGHMQVVPDGRPCECGNRGCWEQYASGNALVREARDLLVSRSSTGDVLRALSDNDHAALTGPTVTTAARGGDPAAVAIFDTVGRWLGLGLANLTAAFDPGCIVVGGGVSTAGEMLLGPARAELARVLVGRGFRAEPPVLAAHLGADAGFVGAADLARSTLRSAETSAFPDSENAQ